MKTYLFSFTHTQCICLDRERSQIGDFLFSEKNFSASYLRNMFWDTIFYKFQDDLLWFFSSVNTISFFWIYQTWFSLSLFYSNWSAVFSDCCLTFSYFKNQDKSKSCCFDKFMNEMVFLEFRFRAVHRIGGWRFPIFVLTRTNCPNRGLKKKNVKHGKKVNQ